jgi:hypothetical protein
MPNENQPFRSSNGSVTAPSPGPKPAPRPLLDSVRLAWWLEWAGSRLIAMPDSRPGPRDPRALWPEYGLDPWQILEFRGRVRLRVPPPSADEIPIVFDILLLPNVCREPQVRQILHKRALVHPLSGRYLFPWALLAATVSVKVSRVRQMHELGLAEAVLAADRALVSRIATFFRPAAKRRGCDIA